MALFGIQMVSCTVLVKKFKLYNVCSQSLLKYISLHKLQNMGNVSNSLVGEQNCISNLKM